MTSWEKELMTAVANNDLVYFKSILNRDKLRRNGDLLRKEWKDGETPLHLAAARGSNEMIRTMTEAGFDVNSYGNGSGRATSLHWAVYHNQASTVKLLLDLGADHSLKGKRDGFWSKGGTPLDWAKQKGCDDIVKILEEHKGKPSPSPARSPAIHTSFDTMDPMTKLIQRPIKIQELEEAQKINSEIGHMKVQVKKLQDKIAKAEEETRIDKTNLEYLLSDLKKHEAIQPSGNHLRMLQMQLDEIEAISLSLKGIVLPNQTMTPQTSYPELDTCPICFMFPQQVFSCQTCGHWICQDCRYNVVACPQCRQDLRGKPMMRNMAVERMLRDK